MMQFGCPYALFIESVSSKAHNSFVKSEEECERDEKGKKEASRRIISGTLSFVEEIKWDEDEHEMDYVWKVGFPLFVHEINPRSFISYLKGRFMVFPSFLLSLQLRLPACSRAAPSFGGKVLLMKTTFSHLRPLAGGKICCHCNWNEEKFRSQERKVFPLSAGSEVCKDSKHSSEESWKAGT
jgi:hypothetical protein